MLSDRVDSLKALARLAWRNILRQGKRSVMTLAAIVFGSASLVLAGGFVQDIFVQLAEALIHSKTGHLQIGKAGFFTYGSRSPDKFLLGNAKSDRDAISTLPEVDAAMSRINFSGLLNNGKTDLPIIGEGIEPDLETRLGTYVKTLAGRPLTDKDAFGIALGEGVARTLKLEPGARVTLLANTPDGALNTLDLEVIGVFQTFSKEFDARAVRITLGAAQELLNTKGVNNLVILLKDTKDTQQVYNRLLRAYDPSSFDVKTWIQLNDFYEKTIALYKQLFGVLQLVILLLVLLGVINVINVGILERTGEFGTMRALGNRNSDVLMLIVTEGVLFGALGSGIGVLIGVALALGISKIGIPMPPPPNSEQGYVAYVRVVPLSVASAFGIGFMATIVASVFPAIRMSRMELADQLRHNI